MLDRRQARVILAHEPPFALGAVRFHPAHRLASNGERSVVVEPRVMQLLVALARANGAVLSRDDIMDQCWDGRIVGDNALHRAVGRARRLLAMIGAHDFEIETVKGVGYRLRSGDWASEPPSSAMTANLARGGGIVTRRGMMAAVGAGGLAAATGLLIGTRRARPPSALAKKLYAQAEAARKSDNLGATEQALSLYREALRDSPDFAAAWGALSLTYCGSMQGALDAELGALARLALSSADRCLQLDDRNLDGRLTQMVVPSHFRIWQDRKDRLKPFADQYPRHWAASAYVGRVTADMGDAHSAVEYVGRALEADPLVTGAAGQLAYALWAQGRLHEVEQILDVSGSRWQRSWFLWNVRFHYLTFSGQYEAASRHVRDEATKPFNLRPDAVNKRLRLIQALQHGRLSDRAASTEAYFAEGIERPPHVRNAAQALAALGAQSELLELLRGYLLGRGKHATPLNSYSRRPTYFLFLPHFEPFWSEPAFVALMNEIGLQRALPAA